MKTRILGKTGLEVTLLGAGQSPIGMMMSRDEMDDAGRALNTFLDEGINFLDTAPCYIMSQETMGRFISHRRSEYLLATKTGHHPDGFHLLTGRPWTAATIRESIERSLKTLKTDYVDLLQLHSCNLRVLQRGEAIEALQAAKQAGKTRFIGYSGDGDEAIWAVNSGHFDTLQTTYNLVDQDARSEVLPLAAEKDMGVIIKRPIANGAWGAPTPPVAGPEDIGEPAVMLNYFERAKAMQEGGPIPGAPGDRIELAMGFVFSQPEVHTAIVGTRKPDHIRANIDMVENRLPLAAETVAELHRRFDDVGYWWPPHG